MDTLPSLADLATPPDLQGNEIVEVVVGGRWISVKPGTYREGAVTVRFESPEGRIYTTEVQNVQLKRWEQPRG